MVVLQTAWTFLLMDSPFHKFGDYSLHDQSMVIDRAKDELLDLLRRLFVKIEKPVPALYENSYIANTENGLSNLSAYLNVERSKSLNSALKKCNRSAEEKKVVSFADSMGLDLCHIRPIFPYNTSDEELFSSSPPVVNPTIRSSNQSVNQLRNTSSLNCPRYLQLKSSPYPVWKDHLQVQRDLANKAKNNGICLKSSNVIGMTFSGVISVLNISYSKQVFVRYTVDKWTSFVEMPAQFLNSNHQEKLDYFTFSIFLPSTIPVGAMCEFCLKYVCEGKEFWDNNDGSNYVLEVRTLAASYLDIQRDFDHPRFY